MIKFKSILLALICPIIVLNFTSCELVDENACKNTNQVTNTWNKGDPLDAICTNDVINFITGENGSQIEISNYQFITISDICTEKPVFIQAELLAEIPNDEDLFRVSIDVCSKSGNEYFHCSRANLTRSGPFKLETLRLEYNVFSVLVDEGFPGEIRISAELSIWEPPDSCPPFEITEDYASAWFDEHVIQVKVTVDYTRL